MTRRVVAALAGAVVLSSAFAAAPAHAASWNANYVAFGDSFAAGTGVPGASGSCLTSPQAYPNLLSKKVDSLACSGANSASLSGQIDAAKALSPAASINGQRTVFRTQQLTLTLGGTDVGWLAVLQACLSAPGSDACAQAMQQTAAAIATQPTRTAAAVQQLRAEAPKAQILVTGYPRLFDPVIGQPCDLGSGVEIPAEQVALLKQFDDLADALNAAIGAGVASANDSRAEFVGVAGEFDGHGACRGADAWINGLIATEAGINPGSFHPNAQGEQAYARVVRAAL